MQTRVVKLWHKKGEIMHCQDFWASASKFKLRTKYLSNLFLFLHIGITKAILTNKNGWIWWSQRSFPTYDSIIHIEIQTTLKAGTVTHSMNCYINLVVIFTLFQIKESFSHESVPTTRSVWDQKTQTNIISANANRKETGQLQISEEKLSHLNFLSGDHTKSRFLHRGEEFLTKVIQYFFWN